LPTPNILLSPITNTYSVNTGDLVGFAELSSSNSSTSMSVAPLIDRVEEMAVLKEAADQALNDQGRIVILRGEPGIGKTRLTQELRAYARSKGMHILFGRCPTLFRMNGVPPYMLWKEVIRDYLQLCTPEQLHTVVGYYPGEIAKLVPEIKRKLITFSESPPLSPDMERDRLFEAVSQFITNISKTTPLVMVLDDLQWADPSSLLLLHYLSRGIYRENLLLVGAYRDSEVEDRHPLTPLLSELNRVRLLKAIQLRRLSRDDVAQLIRQILGKNDVPTDFCDRIYEKTGGNPFFVEEVLAALREEGVIVLRGDRCEIKPVGEIEFPKSVKDILKTRIGRVDEECQNVLRLASLVGNDFTFAALLEVTGFKEDRLLKIIGAIEETGLFKCKAFRGEEVVSFGDVLVREVIYEEINPFVRKKLHGTVASALEKAYADEIEEHYGELASHFLEAGQKDEALNYYLKAGEKAAKIYANSEACAYYESALRLLEEKKSELREKARVLEVLGDVKSLIGEYKACLKYWNEAMLLWKQLEEKESVAILHRKSSGVLLHKMGNTEKAKEHQCRALEILEAQPESVELVQLRADMAHMYWHVGDTAAALPLAEKALETAQRLGSQEAIASSYLVWGKIVGFMGERRKNIDSLKKGLKTALENGYAETAVDAYLELARAQGEEKSLEYLQEGYDLAKKVGAISAQSWCGSHLAGIYLGMGNTDKALSLIEEAVELDRKTGNLHNLCVSLTVLGSVYMMWGEYGEAERFFKEALDVAEKQNIIPAIGNAYYRLGNLHFTREEYRKAIEFFGKAAETLNRIGFKSAQVGLHYGAIWASIKLGELEQLEERINMLQMTAQRLNDESVLAEADVSWALLFRAQKKWNESIGYFEKSLQEAEAHIRRWNVRGYARMFLSEYARVYLERNQKGDREKARDLLNQALELFRKMNAKKDIEKTEAVLLGIEMGGPISWETKLIELVATGNASLDKLFCGGIHPGLAVALTSPSCEQRDTLIKGFLETGAKRGDPTFYLTINPSLSGYLAEEFASDFCLFVCNPQAETIVSSAPNVFKLKGVENLTNINIAVTQAIRKIDPASKGSRRICIDLISDLLLHHGPVQTRKWLTELLAQLKSAGFTTLAVVDPQMHPAEHLHAVLSLFDGEVSIREGETDEGAARFLRIKRVSNQKYLKEETRLV
jgi:tetratricopeptide (TPR) repeat protein/KaiC/GvpD/RAD55 family RecA-like ATPase